MTSAKSGNTGMAWPRLGRNCWAVLFSIVALNPASTVSAGPIKVDCKGESEIVPGWTDGTLSVVYDDNPVAKLLIKGRHIDFSLSASLISMASAKPPSTIISASGQTQAIMPDLTAVDSCVASKIPASQKTDQDAYLNTALSCFEAAPPSKTPVPVAASVKVGLMMGDSKQAEPWFEGEITYSDRAAGPGGKLTIPLLPGECKLVP